MASVEALRVLRGLQSLPENKVCCDCKTPQPSWCSVTLGCFMCLECSGKHRGLGVHISFVRSVTMDAWSQEQLKKMQLGGNDKLNTFLKQYGIDKFTDIKEKYNTEAAEFYRQKLRAQAEGRSYTPPPPSSVARPSPSAIPRNRSNQSFNSNKNDDWDDWGEGATTSTRTSRSPGLKSGNSAPNLTTARAGNEYTMSQLETSARNKDAYFASKLAENASRPEGLPPSQGGKFVGFGSGPPPAPRRGGGGVEDVTAVLSKTVLSVTTAAGSAARSASSAVADGKVAENVSATAAAVADKSGRALSSLWNLSKKAYANVASTVETVARDNGYKVDLGGKDMERALQQETMRQRTLGGDAGGYGSSSSQLAANGWNDDSWGGSSGGVAHNSAPAQHYSNDAASAREAGGFAGFDESGADNNEWDAWDGNGSSTSPAPGRPGTASARGTPPRPSSRSSTSSMGRRGSSSKLQAQQAPVSNDDEWGKW